MQLCVREIAELLTRDEIVKILRLAMDMPRSIYLKNRPVVWMYERRIGSIKSLPELD